MDIGQLKVQGHCAVLAQGSRVIQEAMNIKNYQDKGLNCLNSKAEYRQAPIVRTKRQVTVGL